MDLSKDTWNLNERQTRVFELLTTSVAEGIGSSDTSIYFCENINWYNLLKRQLAECIKTRMINPHIPTNSTMPPVVVCPREIMDVHKRRPLQCCF